MGRKHTGIIENKNSITIEFRYRRRLCRETIKIKPTPRNIKFAINKRSQVLVEIQTGVFNYINHFPDSKTALYFGHKPKTMSIEKAIDRWIATRVLKESTKIQYEYYKKIIVDYFGHDSDITSLKQSDLALLVVHLTHTLSSKTITTYSSVFNGTLRMLFEDGIMKTRLKLIPPKSNSRALRKIDPFTNEELEAIMKVVPERMKYFLIFNVETGLRTGEMFALRWEDIDWEKRQIVVKHNIYNGNLTSTKTNKERAVDLTNVAIDVLKKSQHMVCDYVFLHGQNGRFISTRHLLPTWKRYLRRAKVRYRPIYMLRHTYASRLLSAGIHPRYVADQMGHSTTRLIETTYYAFIEKAKPDIDSMLTKAFGERVHLK